MYAIEQLTEADLPLYRDHMKRHFAKEDDQEGIIYHPLTDFSYFDTDEFIQNNSKSLQKKLNEEQWHRVWVVKDQQNIIAHINLKGGRLSTMLHRTSLGIGIESNYRGKGLGKKLMSFAITWAREQKFIWLDLYVHAQNYKAMNLYKKLGFNEIGTTKDSFRVNGVSIDDTHMTLKL